MKASKVVLAVLATILVLPTCWAQQKYKIVEGPNSRSEYVKEEILDVRDRPGHQLRIYQIHVTYPEKDFKFAGVTVKESNVHGMSDYTNWTGSFTTYTVYSLVDGSEIYSRGEGTTQSTMGTGGKRAATTFSFVETFFGGTKGFKGIRGQLAGGGERAPGANTLTQYSAGEYWIDQ